MEIGDLVDDFELADQYGTPRRLSELLEHGRVVLFFFPAALSPGCTAESCHFRDLQAELAAVGARPIGISSDPVERQKQFADKHGFGYPLLSDPDRVVIGAFGVRRNLALAPTKRKTFIIDTDRRVLAVISSEVRMSAHADRALAFLRQETAEA